MAWTKFQPQIEQVPEPTAKPDPVKVTVLPDTLAMVAGPDSQVPVPL